MEDDQLVMIWLDELVRLPDSLFYSALLDEHEAGYTLTPVGWRVHWSTLLLKRSSVLNDHGCS